MQVSFKGIDPETKEFFSLTYGNAAVPRKGDNVQLIEVNGGEVFQVIRTTWIIDERGGISVDVMVGEYR